MSDYSPTSKAEKLPLESPPHSPSKMNKTPRVESEYDQCPILESAAAPVCMPHEAILESQVAETGLPPRMSTWRMFILATGMMMTYFVGTASTASVTLLIPVMARDLGEPELQVQWISSAYTLSYACSLLFSGRLADIFGRRRLYMAGLTIYAIFGIITGAVKRRLVMCVTRALSGMGLAIATPAGFGIIGVNIRHEPARTIVFAAFGLGNPVGAAFGNLIGGVMASIGQGGWSYLFYLLAGLAIVLLIIAYFVVPADPVSTPGKDRRIDWVGGALITAAICLFTFSLTESGIAANGWKSPHVPALLVTSLILLVLFTLWSLRLETRTSYPPIIKMSLFTRRKGLISYTCATCFFQSISVYGWVYTSTIYYQNYRGTSALQNSIYTLPCTVIGVIAASGVMFLAPRVNTPHLLGIGAALTSCCSILYATVPEGTIYWAMEFPAQILLPWGIDFAFGLGNILISNLVDQNEQSVGGALFQTSGQVGAALGICLTSLIATQVGEQKESLLTGVRAAFWFASGAGMTVVAIAYWGFRHVKLAKDVGQIAH